MFVRRERERQRERKKEGERERITLFKKNKLLKWLERGANDAKVMVQSPYWPFIWTKQYPSAFVVCFVVIKYYHTMKIVLHFL